MTTLAQHQKLVLESETLQRDPGVLVASSLVSQQIWLKLINKADIFQGDWYDRFLITERLIIF